MGQFPIAGEDDVPWWGRKMMSHSVVEVEKITHSVLRREKQKGEAEAQSEAGSDPHPIFSPIQLDFWLSPRGLGNPIDIRVPFRSLQPVKAHLEANGVPYSIMIEDVQVSGAGVSGGWESRAGEGRGFILPHIPQALVDLEKMQMLRRRRFVPFSTSTFDYTSYHTLDEVIFCMGEAQDLGHFGGKKTPHFGIAFAKGFVLN